MRDDEMALFVAWWDERNPDQRWRELDGEAKLRILGEHRLFFEGVRCARDRSRGLPNDR